MKHSILLLLCCCVTYFVIAQKIESYKVPPAVKTSFARQYPDIKNTNWEIENGQYEASFKDKSGSHSAVFAKDGAFIESEIDIKIDQLPAASLDYMKVHYKTSSIREASKITKADGTVNFEAAIKGKDIIFDEHGKFIKEAKD